MCNSYLDILCSFFFSFLYVTFVQLEKQHQDLQQRILELEREKERQLEEEERKKSVERRKLKEVESKKARQLKRRETRLRRRLLKNWKQTQGSKDKVHERRKMRSAVVKADEFTDSPATKLQSVVTSMPRYWTPQEYFYWMQEHYPYQWHWTSPVSFFVSGSRFTANQMIIRTLLPPICHCHTADWTMM